MHRASRLILILALSGCTIQVVQPQTEAPAPTTPTARRAAPTPPPASAVAVEPEPDPAEATVVPGTGTLLTGVVRIDPHYIIAAGGGNIISTGGLNIIASGGGNLIGHDSGSYVLMQAAGGDLLPVKGMQVEAHSMLTGKRLAGPVDTDENGVYELEVPKDVAGNVLVKGSLPSLKNDPRLQYRLMTDPDKQEREHLDEDTSLASRMVLETLAIRVESYLTRPVEENLAFFPAIFKEMVRANVEVLHREGAAARVTDMAPDVRRKVSEEVALILLGHARVHEARNLAQDETVLTTLTEGFRKIREALDKKLEAAPAFKDDNPTGLPIEKVTDVGDFILKAVARAKSQDALVAETQAVLTEIGAGQEVLSAFFGAYMGILAENARTLRENPQAALDIRAALQKHAPPPADPVASDAIASDEAVASDSTATP